MLNDLTPLRRLYELAGLPDTASLAQLEQELVRRYLPNPEQPITGTLPVPLNASTELLLARLAYLEKQQGPRAGRHTNERTDIETELQARGVVLYPGRAA